MLPRVNRLTSAADYRRVVRGGTRVAGRALLAYRTPGNTEHTRFGFVVSRRVGGAVQRNQLRRRLKAACAELLPSLPGTHDVVFRALPGAATASWSTLAQEVARAMERVRAGERTRR